MADDNKPLKYIRYAIGEIVLVVIGILIALSINNWNKAKIEHQKEQVYLANIKRDLQHQLVSIELQLKEEQKYLEKVQPFLNNYNQNHVIKLDSITTRNLSSVTSRKTFVRTDPTYTDLISSGNIDILKDISFKNKLIEYYQNLERIEKINHNNNLYLNDQIYASNILKLIYFYDEYESIPNSEELVEISNGIVNTTENKLYLINLVNFRKHLANASTESMLEIKTETQELLNLINNRSNP